jgi:hypothetical protein
MHRKVASAFQAFDYNVRNQTTSEIELVLLDAGVMKSVVEKSVVGMWSRELRC